MLGAGDVLGDPPAGADTEFGDATATARQPSNELLPGPMFTPYAQTVLLPGGSVTVVLKPCVPVIP